MDCGVKCGIIHLTISGFHYGISMIKPLLSRSVC